MLNVGTNIPINTLEMNNNKGISNDMINKHIEKYDEYSNKFIEHKYSFVKFITSISITLIGLLVALTKFDALDCISGMLFLTSIFLLVCCILFSLIFLSSQSAFHKKEADNQLLFLKEYIQNNGENPRSSEYITIGKTYEFFEKLTYVCFLLWSIVMIIYTYFLIY